MESIRDIMSEALTNTMKEYESNPEETPVSSAPPAEPAPQAEPEAGASEPEKSDQPDKPANDQPDLMSVEELGKLVEEGGAEALDAIDQSRLEKELQEKIKLIDLGAQKKYQAVADKAKQLDGLMDEVRKAQELVNKQREKYKEILGDEDEDDPKLAAAQKELAEKTRMLNWQTGVDTAKGYFPDFGMYGVTETLSAIETEPALQELMMEKDGKYAGLALAAAHLILQRKPENWSKIVASEIESNEETYKAQIDNIIKRRLKEAQSKNEKKKAGITKVSPEAKEEAPKPKEQGRASTSVGGMFGSEFVELANNPDKLAEALRRMKQR